MTVETSLRFLIAAMRANSGASGVIPSFAMRAVSIAADQKSPIRCALDPRELVAAAAFLLMSERR